MMMMMMAVRSSELVFSLQVGYSAFYATGQQSSYPYVHTCLYPCVLSRAYRLYLYLFCGTIFM